MIGVFNHLGKHANFYPDKKRSSLATVLLCWLIYDGKGGGNGNTFLSRNISRFRLDTYVKNQNSHRRSRRETVMNTYIIIYLVDRFLGRKFYLILPKLKFIF